MNTKIYFYCSTLLLSLLILKPSLLSAESINTYEEPPILSASEILDKKLLEDDLFTISDKVLNDGYMNQYSIKSDYGDFQPIGQIALEKTIFEIHTTEMLRRKYPTTDVASGAVVDTAEGIVMAPVRGASKAYDTVTDTDKLKKTASSIPKGIVGLFGAAANAVKSGAEFVYETGASAVSGDGERSSAQFDKLGNAVTDAAGSVTGYNKTRRELCRTLQVDPYTKNEVLSAELRRVSRIKSGVAFAGQFGPAMVGIPYVSTINTVSDRAEQVAAYEDPEKIAKLNEEVASTLGLDSDENDSPYVQFSKNKNYSPSMKRVFMSNLERLEGVTDLELFLKIASKAPSGPIAVFFISASESLADYHEREDKLEVMVSEIALPAAVSKKGELVVPLPVDHLVWTEEVATIFTNFENRIKEYPVKRSEVRIAGTVSTRALSELIRLGAEDVKTNIGYL